MDSADAHILENLKELDISELTGENNGGDIEAAQSKLNDVRRQLASIEAELDTNPDVKALARSAKRLEKQEIELAEQVELLQAKSLNSPEENISNIQELIDKMATAKGEQLRNLRLRLKAKIAVTVGQIIITNMQERTNQDRSVSLSITFANCRKIRLVGLLVKRDQRRVHITTETQAVEIDSGKWTA